MLRLGEGPLQARGGHFCDGVWRDAVAVQSDHFVSAIYESVKLGEISIHATHESHCTDLA
jgi:hypothetical protein